METSYDSVYRCRCSESLRRYFNRVNRKCSVSTVGGRKVRINEIEKIFDEAKDRELTDEEVSRVRMLSQFSDIQNKSSRELIPLVRTLKMLITEGRVAADLKSEARKEHRTQIVNEAKTSIEGDAVLNIRCICNVIFDSRMVFS